MDEAVTCSAVAEAVHCEEWEHVSMSDKTTIFCSVAGS